MLGLVRLTRGRLSLNLIRPAISATSFSRSLAGVTVPHRNPDDDNDQVSPASSNNGSKATLYSVYSQMKASVKEEEERRKRASPEWEGEVKRAAKLVQSTGTSTTTNTALDHRAIVGNDLSMLTQNIHKLIESNHPVLHTVARYYFDQGGKHFRPLLVLLVSLATNRCLPRPSDEIFPPQKRLAEITEMIHTASLLHDDVIDIADTRRGKPSANVNYGNKIAVLGGDFLLARASIALAQLQNLRVVELLATVIANLVEGEVMQMKTDMRQLLNFDYYIKKTYLKTATLIAKSCQAAALLAGQQEDVADIAYQFGRNFGLAFQLVDDVLDFTGTSGELGKPAAADLELGLITAPVLFALEESPELLPLVQRQFQGHGDPAKAREIVLRGKGIERTRRMAEEYCQAAVASLLKLPESDARACLINLTEKAILRNY